MKVIQINCVYGKGSTGKITADLHNELLKHNIDSIVLYGRGQKSNDSKVIKICSEVYSHINKVWSMVTGVMYGGCLISTNRAIGIIKKEKPDIVHLQCINGYFINIYRLLAWLNKHKIKTVLTLHAEFMFTANCGHAFDCEKWKTGCNHCLRFKQETKSLFIDNTRKSWNKMYNACKGFDTLIVTSVSPWLMERAKQSPILKDKKQKVVLNGLNTNIFHHYDTSDLRAEMGLNGAKVIFHATPNFNNDPNNIKGGYYIIELAKRMPEVFFIVAGNHSDDFEVPNNMILLGPIKDQIELAKLYSMADLTVIASKKETFSMITAESLSCGTPVVGFKAGGPESIALKDYSEFVEYGDGDKLMKSINDVLNMEINKYRISEEATKMYSKENMCDSFLKVYLIANKKEEC